MNIHTILDHNKDNMIPIRNYKKLFFGANEENGNVKPILSYEVGSKQFVFYQDVYNTFEYPEYATITPISATSLVDNGAWPGIMPARSDRICYAEHCIPIGEKTMRDSFGVYLCTWLYKENIESNTPAIWVDRWYNSACITEEEAYNQTYNESVYINDSVSRLYLEPTVSYKYFKFGNYTNAVSLSEIDSDLIFKFNDFTETSINHIGADVGSVTMNTVCGLLVNDPYLIVNRELPIITAPIRTYIDANENKARILNINTQADVVLDLTNEHSYGLIDFSADNNIKGNASFVGWFKTSNWYTPSHQVLINNGFRGGWNLKIDNGIYNPSIVCVTNSLSSSISVYGTDGNMVYNEDVSDVLNTPISYVVDAEQFAYILAKDNDNSNKQAIFKYDILNRIFTEKLDVNLTNTTYYKLLLDSNNDLVIIYKQASTQRKKVIPRINFPNSSGTATAITPVSTNNISIDLNDVIVGNYGKFDIDNNNNIWKIENNNLYKNTTLIYTGVSGISISCTHDDKVWVLGRDANQYKIFKFDTEEIDNILDNLEVLYLAHASTEIMSVSSALTTSIPASSITMDMFYNVNGLNCCITDVTNGRIYYVNDNGDVTVNSIPQYSIIADDLTLYKHTRKYKYAKNNMPVIELCFVTKPNIETKDINVWSVSAKTDTLINDNWHHLGFTINQTTSTARLYLDTQIISEITYNGDDIYYAYETPISLMTPIGIRSTLLSEIGNTTYGNYGGYVDDIRLYNDVLTQSDVERIYSSKFSYNDVIFNLDTTNNINYIEEIDRFFKFKLPGSKSQFYNIKISGFNVTDPETRAIIEKNIKDAITHLAPFYSELYKITWVD